MNRGIGAELGKTTRTNMTQHRSNHLLGIRVVSGGRLLGRQLSLILPQAVYDEGRETPSGLVTVGRDRWPRLMSGRTGRESDLPHLPHLPCGVQRNPG